MLLPLDPTQREVPVAGGRREPGRVGHEAEPKGDTGVSGLLASVRSMTETTMVTEFFEHYTEALMARDERRVARLYAVPGPILFPGQSLAVSDAAQTEQFFASAWGQYAGVTQTHTDLTVVAETPASVWVDVTWNHVGAPPKRPMYQLVDTGGAWKIAVLTPLA